MYWDTSGARHFRDNCGERGNRVGHGIPPHAGELPAPKQSPACCSTLPRGSPAPEFSWKKVIKPLQALPGQSHPHAAQAGNRQGQHSSFWDWIQCLVLQGEGFPKNILLSKEKLGPSGVCLNIKSFQNQLAPQAGKIHGESSGICSYPHPQ